MGTRFLPRKKAFGIYFKTICKNSRRRLAPNSFSSSHDSDTSSPERSALPPTDVTPRGVSFKEKIPELGSHPRQNVHERLFRPEVNIPMVSTGSVTERPSSRGLMSSLTASALYMGRLKQLEFSLE